MQRGPAAGAVESEVNSKHYLALQLVLHYPLDQHIGDCEEVRDSLHMRGHRGPT